MAITAKDMQIRKNDVKARTTLLLALLNEHQLRFSKYDTAKELWEAILQTFGGNEATKKTMKNQLKQQYGNFKAEGSKILEHTFNSGKRKVPTIQGVSTASAQVSTDSTDIDNDIEEMDVKWNLASLSMRADRESRSPRRQDRGKRESYKKDPKNHALVANEEEVPTEYALRAKSSSSSDNEVYNNSFCSKSCRKNTENLNTKISKLNEELSNYETDLYNYKRGLSQVEARLVELKENEIIFCEKIKVLKRDIKLKDNKIEYLRNELEEVKKEKESIEVKIENFENGSKDLDKLLESQKLDKDKKGVGFNEYCAIPPPPAQVYSPHKKDLS
uniref:Uncharacterized protein n=1 Tax=Tanacetum cinerariifolium TaxID=118510 RepID=A0A6L2KLD2_TANCI|nr:hypothetical protein [Tanacetum cinerariifolium]